jgi:hypothetical protein
VAGYGALSVTRHASWTADGQTQTAVADVNAPSAAQLWLNRNNCAHGIAAASEGLDPRASGQ